MGWKSFHKENDYITFHGVLDFSAFLLSTYQSENKWLYLLPFNNISDEFRIAEEKWEILLVRKALHCDSFYLLYYINNNTTNIYSIYFTFFDTLYVDSMI